MTDEETFIVGEVLPRIASVSVHRDFLVAVTWSEGARAGKSDVVDLGPAIMTHKLYAPLRDDPEMFRTVHPIDYGTALGWGDDEEIDMSAEGVEDLVEQIMTAADFRSFMERHKFTQDAAAAQLGISRRQVNYFLTSKAIPRTIALACAYLDRTVIPMPTVSTGETSVRGHYSILDHGKPTVIVCDPVVPASAMNPVAPVEWQTIIENQGLSARVFSKSGGYSGRVSVIAVDDLTSGKYDLTTLVANKPVLIKPR